MRKIFISSIILILASCTGKSTIQKPQILPDELSCRNGMADSCLRMGIRHIGEKGDLSGNYFIQSLSLAAKTKDEAQRRSGLLAVALKINDKDSNNILANLCNNFSYGFACALIGARISSGKALNSLGSPEFFAKRADLILTEECKKSAFQCYLLYYSKFLTASETAKPTDEDSTRLLTRACSMGEPKACLTLGSDQLFKANKKDGYTNLIIACNEGLTDACGMYALSIEKDGKSKEAAKILSDRCSINDGAGCRYAGDVLERMKRFDESLSTYSKGCDLKDRDSCLLAANGYKIAKKISNAKNIYKQMCEDRDGAGCFYLGQVERDLGNTAEALKLYIKSCELKSPRGCMSVYTSAISENISKKFADPYLKKSRELFNQECDSGNDESCDLLKKINSITNKNS